MFDHSCTVAVKDMVSASNLCITSLHKLEPEHEIKWLERFTVFNSLLAAIYTSLSFTSIDTLWGLLVETLLLPSFRTSSRRFLSAVSAKACWVPTICASLCVYIYIQFIHLYSLDISGLSYSTILLGSILLHTLELHCMIFHCTVFSHHLLQCHHLALHYIPWCTIIVSYILYISCIIYIQHEICLSSPGCFFHRFKGNPAYMDSCSISVPSEKPEVGSLSIYNYIIIYTHPNVLFSLYFHSGIFRRTSACEASHCLFDFILGQRLLDVDGCMAPKL